MAEHNKYNNSKIYKLVSASSDKIYVGSTTQLLCKRLQQHLGNYKDYTINNNKPYTTSYEIIKLGDYSIQLIEQCNFNNKQQLHEREGHYIKLHRDICVNKLIAGRTHAEYRQDNKEFITEISKQYYINNKEYYSKYNKEYNKEYNINNKEHLTEYNKQYYIDNKEHLTEYIKQYRVNNKQVLTERKKQTIQCECGITTIKYHLNRHQQTTNHFTNINKSYLNELTTL